MCFALLLSNADAFGSVLRFANRRRTFTGIFLFRSFHGTNGAHAHRVRKVALRLLLFAAGAALLTRAFWGVDWAGTWHVLSRTGAIVVVVLVPFGVSMLLDTSAVLLVARGASLELPAPGALLVRVVSEALHFGAPGGVVASEAAAIAMYSKRCGLAPAGAMVLGARRKQLVMRAHSVYLVLGGCLGAPTLATLGAPPWLVIASAAIPLATSFIVGRAVRVKWRESFERVTRARRTAALGTFMFLAAWFVEAAETAIVMHVVGFSLSMRAALAIECAISLARSAVAFVPGGLGVQDLGYTTAFTALGVAHENAVAFALLKRAKEIVWIAIGFVVSAWLSRQPSPEWTHRRSSRCRSIHAPQSGMSQSASAEAATALAASCRFSSRAERALTREPCKVLGARPFPAPSGTFTDRHAIVTERAQSRSPCGLSLLCFWASSRSHATTTRPRRTTGAAMRR